MGEKNETTDTQDNSDIQDEVIEEASLDAEIDADEDQPEAESEITEILEESSIEELAERVIELEKSNADLADQYVRAKAETDNTRRISTKEVERARKFALESFAKELLQVKDSLDQASQVDLQEDSGEQLIKQMNEGLSLTTRQLDTIFDRFNISEIKPETGDAVDPELHQAMTMQPSDELEANQIIAVIQTGYQLNTRLLRPAMVIVSSGPQKK